MSAGVFAPSIGSERSVWSLPRFRYKARMASLLVLALSVIDGLITMSLLTSSADELNPVMRAAIERGPAVFLCAKLALTGGGLALLMCFRQRRLFRSRFRAKHALAGLAGVYAALLAYEFVLLWMSAV